MDYEMRAECDTLGKYMQNFSRETPQGAWRPGGKKEDNIRVAWWLLLTQ